MGGYISFSSKPFHDGFNEFLKSYDVSLDTYQLGQMLTRSMFFLKNGKLGGWTTAGASRCEQKFAAKAQQLSWREKLELALTLKDARRGNDLIEINKTRLKLSQPLLYYIYGDEHTCLMRSSSFLQALEIYNSFKKNISDVENVESKSGLKMYTKSELIRERSLKVERLKKVIENKEKKKFIRGAPLIEHDANLDQLIYYPENHPYFREWLLYNYAFWSPIFKSRTLLNHKDPSNVKTIKSRDLIEFLAKKFKLEHPIEKINLPSKIKQSDQSSVILEKPIDEKFFSEKNISDLLYKNSFFKNERLASVYELGIIDRDIVALTIESLEPFKEYKTITLSPRILQVADILMGTKSNKKVA